MKTVLIVGGAGYIGTVLTDDLLNSGYKVKTLDNFLYGNNHCILPYLGRSGFSFLFGDMCNSSFLKTALELVTDVIILGGLVGDPISKKYPEIAHKINDLGVKNVIDSCNGKRLNSVVFVSTCSNYGLINEGELATEEHELNPLSLYAKSKVAAEQYLLSLKGKVDYRATVLRFATAFGLSPRMRFDLTVSEFTRDLVSGKELLVYDAQTWRPYCHVRDFGRLIIKVLETSDKTVDFEVFNAGGDVNNFTKQGIVDLILSKVPQGLVKYQEHGSDPRNYRVDFRKAREQLGFEPKYSVSDGVDELLEAIKNKAFDNVDDFKDLYGNYSIRSSS